VISTASIADKIEVLTYFLIFVQALSPDSKYALAGSEDGTTILWDIRDLDNITYITLKGHSDAIRSVAFSPDSKYVLTGSKDKTIRLWNIKPSLTLEQVPLFVKLAHLKQNYKPIFDNFDDWQEEALKRYCNT
jgi:WD40 repeat protein